MSSSVRIGQLQQLFERFTREFEFEDLQTSMSWTDMGGYYRRWVGGILFHMESAGGETCMVGTVREIVGGMDVGVTHLAWIEEGLDAAEQWVMELMEFFDRGRRPHHSSFRVCGFCKHRVEYELAEEFNWECPECGMHRISQEAYLLRERMKETQKPDDSDERPRWVCSQWGQHEHDWLSCPECLQGYEDEQEASRVEIVEEGVRVCYACKEKTRVEDLERTCWVCPKCGNDRLNQEISRLIRLQEMQVSGAQGHIQEKDERSNLEPGKAKKDGSAEGPAVGSHLPTPDDSK